MKKRTYTDLFKINVVDLYSKGESSFSISNKYKISRSTIYNWINQYKIVKTKDGKEITARQLYLLEKKVESLTIENKIWRLSNCATNSPLKEKLEAISRLKDKFGVHAPCETLGVLRSTFYHYQLRRPEKTLIELQDEQLRPIIADIFEKSKQRFGSKKIKVKLEERGLAISTKRILRLMKELNLSTNRSKPSRYANNLYRNRFFQNKLKKQFIQPDPNLVWASDITYVKINRVNFYVCVVIDLFSRKVLASSLSDQINSDLVILTFHKAKKLRTGQVPQMFHSDQGIQYTSYKFRDFLRKQNISQSFSALGYPYDNAVVESFFSSLKKEEVHRNVYNTIEELQQSLNEYILFFNAERPHQKLDFKTPDAFEEEYYKQIKKMSV